MIRSLLMLVTAAWLLVPGTTRGEPDAHFHMTGTLQGAGTLDPACNGFRYATAGPFDGTPLGPVHWMGSECVDAASNPGGFALAGTFSFDDGLLVGGYQGHAGFPDAAGRVYGWGTFSITGVSGAYAGATGTGIFTVDAQPLTSTAHFELIGTLERAA